VRDAHLAQPLHQLSSLGGNKHANTELAASKSKLRAAAPPAQRPGEGVKGWVEECKL
jgi:hypothetical protein